MRAEVSNPTDQGELFRLHLDGDGGAVEQSANDLEVPSWVHFRFDSDDASQVQRLGRVNARVAESLVFEDARPRATAMSDGLLVVLRGVNLNPGAEPEDMVSVRMWVDEARVVTVSPRRVMAIEDVRGALAEGNGPRNATDVLIAILMALLDRMSPVVDELEDLVDELQVKLLAGQPEGMQRELSELRNTVAQIWRHLAPQRDALVLLSNEPAGFLNKSDLAHIREAADRKKRLVEGLDSVRERALVVQDELNHIATDSLNRNMYNLSVVAAIFLPLSLITGLLGINVGGIPWAQSEIGFWLVLGLLVVTALFELAIMRALKVL